MFTGIVEEQGRVVAVDNKTGRDARLRIRGARVLDDAGPGDSIAVDGVCLTVAELPGEGTFAADVMPETLRRTTLGRRAPGDAVNLERAVAVDGRLGGHIVQGHVDGTGRILSRRPGPRWDEVEIGLDPSLARYVAPKGSIAVSGVSLTVTHVTDDRLGVSLIPTTLRETTLGELVVGDEVNLEVDVLAKYVERLLAGAATR